MTFLRRLAQFMPRPRRRVDRLHIIASLGGHLELAFRIIPVLQRYERTWITSEGSRAQDLRDAGATVRVLPRLDRGTLGIRSVTAGITLALRERPTCVVTTGAGIAVPFTLTSWLLGARVIFIETMASVTRASMTGRALAPFSEAVLVQWPELERCYGDATVCQPQLIEGVTAVGGRAGEGTFVTMGSHDQPFKRLLDAVHAAAADGMLPAPVFVQTGAGAIDEVAGLQSVDYVSPTEFERRVRESQVIVTHAGAGAISAVMREGKRPLVMARRRQRREHVDDHQVEIVRKLAETNAIVELTGHGISAADIAAASEHVTLESDTMALPTLEAALSQLLDRLGARRRV